MFHIWIDEHHMNMDHKETTKMVNSENQQIISQ